MYLGCGQYYPLHNKNNKNEIKRARPFQLWFCRDTQGGGDSWRLLQRKLLNIKVYKWPVCSERLPSTALRLYSVEQRVCSESSCLLAT
jgi:hypothetical protein